MPKVKQRVYARPPWERMMRIHQALHQDQCPNCRSLARELEVVPRTIKRDLDFMKCRLHLPIAYDELRWGFRYTAPVEQFPSLPITEAEVFALLVAHKAIAQYHGTPFQRLLETAFKKLTGHLDDETRFSLGSLDAALSFRPFAPEDADLASFEVLTRGLQERRLVEFGYRNLGTKTVQKRRVHPYHLACIDNHWYLFAFDAGRQAMRTFALVRMQRPVLTDERFTRAKNFNADEYLKGSFTVFKGREDYEVVIEFDAWATDLVRGRRWHGSQEFTELPGGGSRLRLRLNSLEELERWVLGWGAHATVIRPRALVERLVTTVKHLSARYAGIVS